MKYAAALFTAALLAVTPAAAQQHPQSHPTSHVSRPTTHAPTSHSVTHPHVASRHPTTHSVAHHRHPASHTHHAVSHRRHPTTHAVHRTVRAASHAGFHRASPAVIAKFRRNVVAVRRFHAGPYRALPGWRYRRWGFGERLPAIYFGRDFWITDFLAFGLVAPPDGLIWVRYGPDAMLIDQYTGEVIQVDYGVFY